VNKVAVFALDGATFEVIRPAVEQGELPHIGALLERGASGELESTIPPITGAAWTSFQTGVSPGRHGAFDWLTREEGSYRLRPISSQMIRQPRLWDYIGEQGGRVGVVGVPVTYPPRAVNGFLISGLLTPEGASYTYPVELARELEARIGGFPFMPDHWRGRYRASKWLAGLARTLDQRKRIARYLLREHEWDFFMLHLMEIDSAQHQMWHLRDGVARPSYQVKVKGDPILEIYRAADGALGELLAELPGGTTVFLISDHGFGPLYWNIYLNTWLLEQGYLVFKRGAVTGLRRAAFRLGLTQERLFSWAERLRLLERGTQLRHGQLHDLLGRLFLSLADADWRRTKAYSYGNIGQIYLNRRGREPEGIVREAEAEGLIEELIAKLRKLVNPYTGEPVIEKIHRKEELYSGEKLAWAPEILFLPRRGCMTLGTTDFPAGRIVAPTFAGSGWHELFGVLIAAGGNLEPGELQGAHLLDMFPTILYAMGLRVPRGLDGRVIEELLKPDYRRAHPIEWFEEEVELALEVTGEPEGWEEEARRRLQDLGYI
jgi:predicted AlkP superfamily phosphohydrolase/phosphomutase